MALTFNPGETKTFQLQAEAYKGYPRHWVGREYKICSGAGCALCAAGVSVRTDYMIPIAIGGVSETFIFSQSIAEKLDALTQQGHRLMGLMIKVGRTGSGRDTRYSLELPGQPSPVAPPQPGIPQPVTPVAPVIQPVTRILPDGGSIGEADHWAKLMQRLLYRKDFLDLIAGEIQVMKNEGLW